MRKHYETPDMDTPAFTLENSTPQSQGQDHNHYFTFSARRLFELPTFRNLHESLVGFLSWGDRVEVLGPAHRDVHE